MISALLSDFDNLTPAQRSTVDHWIIDDPDRVGPQGRRHADTAKGLDPDIDLERREGWGYQNGANT